MGEMPGREHELAAAALTEAPTQVGAAEPLLKAVPPPALEAAPPLAYETWRRPAVAALLWAEAVLVAGGGAVNLAGLSWPSSTLYVLWVVLALALAVAAGWIAFAAVVAGDQAPDPGLAPVALEPDQRASAAVVVVHGIGQQERYETLSLLVTGLDGVPANRPKEFPYTAGQHPSRDMPARVQVPPADGCSPEDLTGVQILTWREGDTEEPPVPVDVYEVYWAPLAQRQRSLKDVLSWTGETLLMTAGRFGFRRHAGSAGAVVRPADDKAVAQIKAKGRREGLFLAGSLAAGAVVLCLGWLAFEFARWRAVVTRGGTPEPFSWLPEAVWSQVAAAYSEMPLAAIALAGLMLFGFLYWIEGRLKVRTLQRRHVRARAASECGGAEPLYFRASQEHAHHLTGALNQYYFRALLGGVVALTALLGFVGSQNAGWRGSLSLAVLLLTFQQLWVRIKASVVNYLGDIPTYVMASENGSTYQARKQIQQKAQAVIASVLDARHPVTGAPQYERVVVLGHSLGSVVGRDALLGLYAAAEGADSKAGRAAELKRLARVKAYVTFGSPLRKTQAFFEVRAQDSGALEALRRSRDALLFRSDRPDALVRTTGGLVRWYNFWEMNDLVSNPLRDRYPVCWESTVPLEPAERTPLFTHSDYWGAKAFAGAVLRIIRDEDPTLP